LATVILSRLDDVIAAVRIVLVRKDVIVRKNHYLPVCIGDKAPESAGGYVKVAYRAPDPQRHTLLLIPRHLLFAEESDVLDIRLLFCQLRTSFLPVSEQW
jgi:hypothetical protein